ncbi:NUDIX domain-containing protein [Sphaerisporangium rubeum]|uniref:8-oxo-dGTP pyrophosphatase MutT (NUDIX family) n=1 Tax=Sphaerisporangium rubeum TaxID=321317 RepID=A0A7X0IFM4_9ACTN|nr:NUDIX domain-containing protein [Sphaerisporangium rubeum]MBB6474341.1 8-oxo-dGTP pyrophosphatase MutT (NUDIX family) [Sphaerisporangium rubeum]
MADLPRHSVSVTAVVIHPDGRVLAIQREDDRRWVPPGGIVELDETPEHAVIREVLEETGVQVKPETLTGVYKNMNLGVVSLTFRCHPISGTPHASDEALESTWLTLDQVQHLMPEARAIRVLDALRDDGPFVRVHDGTQLI